jgi:DnaK suppressor protein
MRRLDVTVRVNKRKLARALRREETELATRAHALRLGISQATAEVRDAVDSSVDSFTRHVGASLLEATSMTARGIETALRRLRKGVYGKCQDCRQAIPAARLNALPFAARCRDCQQEFEAAAWPLPA